MRTIFTNFRCDEPQTTAEPCVVDFDLELPIPEYVDFCKHLDEDYGFISEATGELVKDKHGLSIFDSLEDTPTILLKERNMTYEEKCA